MTEIDALVAEIEAGNEALVPELADRLIEEARRLDEAGDFDAADEALDRALDWVDERTDTRQPTCAK